MEKVITYLYPKEDKASSLKVFQDRTNQIRGYYFTRDNIGEVENLEGSDNYAVYFLFDRSEEDFINLYIGQSKNGIHRMKDHNKKKDFWSYCLLFTTDNNSFDVATIDYMEYYFINKLKDSGEYNLVNKDFRRKEPRLSIYDKTTITTYIGQIEFLLRAEGIDLNKEPAPEALEYYYPKNEKERDLARIYFKDGRFFLVKGSIISYPKESARDWKNKSFYPKYRDKVDRLLEGGKVDRIDSHSFRTLVDLAFDSPSEIANLINGGSNNGWEYFQDLNQIRQL